MIGTQEEGLPESLLFEKNEADAGGQDDDEEYRAEAPLNTAEPGFVVDCRGHLIRSGGAGDGEEGGEEEENGAGGEGHHDDTRCVGLWLAASSTALPIEPVSDIHVCKHVHAQEAAHRGRVDDGQGGGRVPGRDRPAGGSGDGA